MSAFALGFSLAALFPSLAFYGATWGVWPFIPAAAWVALPAAIVTWVLLALEGTRQTGRSPRLGAGIVGAVVANSVFDAARFMAIALGFVPGDFMAYVGHALAVPHPTAQAFVTFSYNYLFMVVPWGAAYGLWFAGRSIGWGVVFGAVLWFLVMTDPIIQRSVGLFGYPHHILFAGFAFVMHLGWGLGLGWLTNRLYRASA